MVQAEDLQDGPWRVLQSFTSQLSSGDLLFIPLLTKPAPVLRYTLPGTRPPLRDPNVHLGAISTAPHLPLVWCSVCVCGSPLVARGLRLVCCTGPWPWLSRSSLYKFIMEEPALPQSTASKIIFRFVFKFFWVQMLEIALIKHPFMCKLS